LLKSSRSDWNYLVGAIAERAEEHSNPVARKGNLEA
jgi:hypothetical protein